MQRGRFALSKFAGLRGRGLLLELAIVVLGVLIALSADSWWEGVKERERERAYVLALVADMSAVRDSLGITLELSRASLTQVSELIRWAESDEPVPTEQPPNIGIYDVYVPTGTLEALVSTGDVNLISEETLRAAVTRELAVLTDHQRILNDVLQTSWLSLFSDMYRSRARAPGVAVIGPMAEFELLRADPDYLAFIAGIRNVILGYYSTQQIMIESVDALLAAGRAALDQE